MDAGGWIQLVLEHAAELRKRGVQHVSAEGFAVHLAPSDLPREPLDDRNGRVEDPILDAMNDPATFGGSLPGYRIPGPEEEIP